MENIAAVTGINQIYPICPSRHSPPAAIFRPPSFISLKASTVLFLFSLLGILYFHDFGLKFRFLFTFQLQMRFLPAAHNVQQTPSLLRRHTTLSDIYRFFFFCFIYSLGVPLFKNGTLFCLEYSVMLIHWIVEFYIF